MATNFPKKVETSEPPQPERKNRTGNLDKLARHQDENETVKKPLQFKVPETVFNEFSRRAHEGFRPPEGRKAQSVYGNVAGLPRSENMIA